MAYRWITVWVILAVAGIGRADQVELLDMQTVDGAVEAIGPEFLVLTTETGEREIAIADIAAVRLGDANDPQPPLVNTPGRQVVELADGSLIDAGGIAVTPEEVTFTQGRLGELTVPFAQLKALWLGDVASTPASLMRLVEELELDRVGGDYLLAVQDDGSILPVEGAMVSIGRVHGEGEVTFHWDDEDRKIGLDRVRGVLIGGVRGPEQRIAGMVTLVDGSRLAFTSLTLTGTGQVTMGCPSLGNAIVPRSQVRWIEWNSERLVPLSELEPTRVTEYGQILDAQSWRIDRSVAGGALVLDGVAYDMGIGLHSYAELTWALDSQYRTFAARAGIDDSVRPRGNATLTILGDGEVLGQEVLTGRTSAQQVIIDLADVDELTIRVDFGEDDLEVSDHVDLAGARLIRAR